MPGQTSEYTDIAIRVDRGLCVCGSGVTCFIHHDCSEGNCTHGE